MTRPFRFADHPGVLISFELGGTASGIGDTLRMIEVAAAAGADAVKLQIIDAGALMGRDVRVGWTDADGVPRTDSMLTLLRSRALTDAEWAEIQACCSRLGLLHFSTVDGPRSLAVALSIGVDALKVCSGDITHLAWIEEVARAGRPVLIDTGHATLGEIERAVDVARGAGAEVCLHHVPGGYPARAGAENLRLLTTMAQVFGDEVVLGFSDHSPGRDMDLMAVALGARQIEKTLTLDRRMWGPEHAMSIEPGEAKEFVRSIRAAGAALGSSRPHVTGSERVSRGKARRSAFTVRPLCAGDRVTDDVIAWRRPAEGGIEPAEANRLIGRTARRFLGADEQITWSDLVGEAV